MNDVERIAQRQAGTEFFSKKASRVSEASFKDLTRRVQTCTALT